MHWFYCPGEHKNFLNLDHSESMHCTKVLRLKPGDEAAVVNGSGVLYYTRIITADPGNVKMKIMSSTDNFGRRDYYLHVAIAPPKNIDRFEWFIEKAIEIGIDEITPVFCKHSERLKIRMDRMYKVAIAAIKQSKKAYLPTFNNPVNFPDFVERTEGNNKFIAHCSGEHVDFLLTFPVKNQDFTVMVGPEGDFVDSEIDHALKKRFIPVSLGQSLLRTETAGIVTAQIVYDRSLFNKFR